MKKKVMFLMSNAAGRNFKIAKSKSVLRKPASVKITQKSFRMMVKLHITIGL